MTLDWLKAIDIVTGLILTALGGIAGAVVWLFRQRRSISDEIAAGHDERTRQFGAQHDQVQRLERRVDTLAPREDVAAMAVTLARIEGQMGQQAERDRALAEHIAGLNQRVTMIYEAMLRKERGE